MTMRMRKGIICVCLLLTVLFVTGCVESNKKDNANESIVDDATISTVIVEENNDTSGITGDTIEIIDDAGGVTNETNISMEDINETITTRGITNENVGVVDDVRIIREDVGFLSDTFKVNDQKVMLDKNIKLLDLATEEGTAVISIDGESHKFTYNMEQKIGGRTIKITDLNGMDQTVKIMIK